MMISITLFDHLSWNIENIWKHYFYNVQRRK